MIRLRIATHSMGELEEVVESFDANEINRQCNDTSINTLLIGNTVVSRIDVKLVTKINENIET